MALRLTARVITQLGAELISSDAVALFELVKNGFDAGSNQVTIRVQYLLDCHVASAIQARLKELPAKSVVTEAQFADLCNQVAVSLSMNEPVLAGTMKSCRQAFVEGASVREILARIRVINTIEVSDQGSGMSIDDVENYFLTVGTTHRQQQHEDHIKRGTAYPSEQPVAGEKGIGRLSAMRLGRQLLLDTWIAAAKYETRLEVDWQWFFDNPEADPSEFEVTPQKVPRIHQPAASGTILNISDLSSDWPKEKVLVLATQHLAKFINPFRKSARRIHLHWNGHAIDPAALTQVYLDIAHNGMRGEVRIDKKGAFVIDIQFWFTRHPSKEKIEVSRRYTEDDFGRISNRDVAAVGPFSFELYHFNRNRLEAIPGLATRNELREWLDEWCGGLMLYRDGLRVLPYGKHPEDDWLELDQRALRGKGFRVNRIQVLGAVFISRVSNPNLRDQTNREGLQENDASRAFHDLMRQLIADCFVSLYREKVEEPSDIEPERLVVEAGKVEDEISAAADAMLTAVNDQNRSALASARQHLLEAVRHVSEVAKAIEQAAVTHQLQRIEVTELAAKGLAAEAMAHDVEAVLDASITDAGIVVRESQLSDRLRVSLRHLIAILKSARVQIAGIKPGPAKRRRRRSTFDLCPLVEQVASLFEPRFLRHEVSFTFEVRPKGGSLTIHAVEGHIRQILENLIRNSLYWVLSQRSKGSHTKAAIVMRCDVRSATLRIRDTGPGFAPEETEWVFVPFNTHRPGGRGLGLAISRDLSEFNAIDIRVDTSETNDKKRYPGIILDFSKCLNT